MKIQVNAAPLYAYTSGKPIDPAKPTVVFIHGVLNDHSVWILETRYFAHHAFNVLAFDLSGPFSMPVMAALITAMTCGLAVAYALAWRVGQASDARISSRGPESRSRRRR